MRMRPFIVVPAAVILLAGPAQAQDLGGLFGRVVSDAKDKVKSKVTHAVDDAVNGSASPAGAGAAGGTAARTTLPVRSDDTPTGADLSIPAAKLPMAAAASWGTVAVTAEGSVTAWPEDAGGQTVHVALPRKVVGAAVHQYTAFFLLDDGTVMGLGKNTYQSLGREGGDAAAPTLIPGLRDIVQVVATYGHALALRRDGVVFAWGEDVDGLRGDSPGDHAPVTRVPGLPAVVQVATAARHSLALGQDGRVYAWGGNGHGELGTGTTGAPAAAAPVPGLDDVVAIAAGLQTSLALKRDGTVWAWGSNQSSMLGDGGRSGSAGEGIAARPVQVPGVSGVRQIVAGEGFVLALLADGTIRAWGFDGYGEIGVGTAGGYHPSPTRVASLAKVVNINAGGYRVFATTADGRQWHWGTPVPVAPGHKPNVKVPAPLEP